jgi:molybdenum cofactor cytidylyltransferase
MTATSTPEKIAAIVLAAGRSERLGRPKQLLEVAGEALVRRATRAALGCGADETLVVTGARSEEVARAVADLGVHLVENPDWEEGMASSIRCGARAAEELGCSAVLVVLADQPHVGPDVLARVVACFREEGRDLVACGYRGVVGAPALFAGCHRELLLQLEGDRGARGVLRAHAERVRVVAFDPGAVDIDDEGAWKAYVAGRPTP